MKADTSLFHVQSAFPSFLCLFSVFCLLLWAKNEQLCEHEHKWEMVLQLKSDLRHEPLQAVI